MCPWKVLPYLGIVGRFRGDVCEIFDPIDSLFDTPSQSDWPPLSAEKNRFVNITFCSTKMYYLSF